MALNDVTDPAAVTAALNEFNRLGRDPFLKKYGFKPARAYFARWKGSLYDSKAIVGAAHGHQHPDHGPLRPQDFSGGDQTYAGFSISSDSTWISRRRRWR